MGQDGPRAIHGFGLASAFYFGKPLLELDTAETATLVAIVRGPSYYNPWRHDQRVRDRRDMVLQILAEQGVINAAEAESATRRDLGLRGGAMAARDTSRRSWASCGASCAATIATRTWIPPA
jgi:penicillin-binding protein 1B